MSSQGTSESLNLESCHNIGNDLNDQNDQKNKEVRAKRSSYPAITEERSSSTNSDIRNKLKRLEEQNEKILNYQKLSFRWQFQHHQNLKLIMLRLNFLLRVLQKQGLTHALDDIVPFEDDTLLPSASSIDIRNNNNLNNNNLNNNNLNNNLNNNNLNNNNLNNNLNTLNNNSNNLNYHVSSSPSSSG